MSDLVITLENNRKYSLVKKVKYNNKEYAYLVDSENYKIYIVVELINDKFKLVDDKKLLSKLIIEFSKDND